MTMDHMLSILTTLSSPHTPILMVNTAPNQRRLTQDMDISMTPIAPFTQQWSLTFSVVLMLYVLHLVSTIVVLHGVAG